MEINYSQLQSYCIVSHVLMATLHCQFPTARSGPCKKTDCHNVSFSKGHAVFSTSMPCCENMTGGCWNMTWWPLETDKVAFRVVEQGWAICFLTTCPMDRGYNKWEFHVYIYIYREVCQPRLHDYPVKDNNTQLKVYSKTNTRQSPIKVLTHPTLLNFTDLISTSIHSEL